MPLTLDQADQAGALSAAIRRSNAAIADLATRIGDVQERGVGANSSSMALDDGTSILADVPLSTGEVAEILGRYKTLLEAKRDAAQAALDAITIV